MTQPTITAPALLLAARAKFLASPEFATAYGDHLIATQADAAQSPAVIIGTDKDGMPTYLDDVEATVTLHLPGKEWLASPTTARFPRLGFTVWGPGNPLGSGEWLARAVADVLIACFDNPSGKFATWGAGTEVNVVSCRYARDLSVYEVEGVNGLFRADLSFDCEIF